MKFPVTTICGSMRYYERMLRVAAKLTSEGVIVIMPHVVAYGGSGVAADKAMLDDMHRTKIDMCDYVTVVTDKDEPHIGESTNAEIQYAAKTNREIRWAFEGIAPESHALTE